MFKWLTLAMVLASAVLAVLRYLAVIDWSWWVIVAPVYAPLLFMGVLCVVGMMLLVRESIGGEE